MIKKKSENNKKNKIKNKNSVYVIATVTEVKATRQKPVRKAIDIWRLRNGTGIMIRLN